MNEIEPRDAQEGLASSVEDQRESGRGISVSMALTITAVVAGFGRERMELGENLEETDHERALCQQ